MASGSRYLFTVNKLINKEITWFGLPPLIVIGVLGLNIILVALLKYFSIILFLATYVVLRQAQERTKYGQPDLLTNLNFKNKAKPLEDTENVLSKLRMKRKQQ